MSFIINSYMFGSPVWNGLIAYYTGDNTPNDSLGNYNGTLMNGATYSTGKINNGFSLDGVNDYVDLGDNFNFNGSEPFSVSLWYYPNDVTSYRTLFGKQSPTAPLYRGWQIQMEVSNVRFGYYYDWTNNNYMVTKSTEVLSTFTWYNIVVTYDGSKTVNGVKFYINTVESSKTTERDTFTTNIDNTGIKATIGSGNGSNYFPHGVIDEVGVWNRVLTTQEVSSIYNSGNGRQYPN